MFLKNILKAYDFFYIMLLFFKTQYYKLIKDIKSQFLIYTKYNNNKTERIKK